MKDLNLIFMALIFFLVGCDGFKAKVKNNPDLTCESSKEGRTKEELQMIADACFRGGSYSKSSGKKWY